jgi:hypothetical protein
MKLSTATATNIETTTAVFTVIATRTRDTTINLTATAAATTTKTLTTSATVTNISTTDMQLKASLPFEAPYRVHSRAGLRIASGPDVYGLKSSGEEGQKGEQKGGIRKGSGGRLAQSMCEFPV